VQNAWVVISAWQGFELNVNGRMIGRALLRRPTWPFQAGASARGQKLAQLEAALSLNFPREYQWAGSTGHQIPTFFDLGPYLSAGENAIAIEVEAREAPARMALEGEILLWSGERIRLSSEDFTTQRRASESPRGWVEAGFDGLDWIRAPRADAPPARLRRVIDPAIFMTPFAGRWLREAVPSEGALWLETRWRLDRAPDDGWLRVLARGPFELFVNGAPVRVASSELRDLDGGEWLIGRRGSGGVPAAPERLDPDEVGSLFGGDRFDSTLPSDEIQPPVVTRPAAEELLEGDPDERALRAGSGPERSWSAAWLRSALKRSKVVAPKELARRVGSPVLYGYGIGRLLHRGENTIAVRVAPPDGAEPPTWSAALAVDGSAAFGDGSAQALRSDLKWRSRHQSLDGALSDWTSVQSVEPAAVMGAALPVLEYRGAARSSTRAHWVTLAESLLLALLGVLVLLRLPGALARWRCSGAPSPQAEGRLWSPGVLVLPTVALLGVLLLDLSWAERSDRLLLAAPRVWAAIVGVAFALGVLAAIAQGRGWQPLQRIAGRFAWPGTESRWRMAAAAVVLLCVFLRAHDLAGQPFDNDELASVQAATAIAREGVPRYGPDIYYSRSPLYHYLAGASVKLFGANFWALRLPAVLFAAATALLIYLAGARLLRSRWIGLAAALLYAVHPYAIFVGHLTRFYQQQQFFCLLTVYLFCQGFVTGESRRHRLGTLAAFTAACLSQELSIVMAPPLLVAAFLFTRRIRAREAVELGVVSACALVLVALDILVFQTRCLTRLEGISPSVEATLHLHFAAPMNVLTLFVSYSRLHLGLSLALLAGLPLLLARRDRAALAMAVVLFGGVLGTMLQVTHEALRYQYWLLPVWLLLGVRGVGAVAESWSALVEGTKRLSTALAVVLFAVVLLGWSPWRIHGSYGARLLGDPSSSFAFVRANLRPGDAVAVTEPHPPQGLMDLGRIDYDLSVPLLQDFVQRKDGRLFDRNGGAEVIGTLEQLQDVLAHRERLWVLVSRERLQSRGRGIRWDHPGARFEVFLRENLEVKYQTYLWTVFLWDASAGQLRPYRRHAEPR
jgi:hypothetical protein